jgi:hypothetical protein
VAQQWVGAAEAPAGALAHLAACAQAALRAFLLGGWGDLEEVQIASSDRYLSLRRLGRGDHSVLLILAASLGVDVDVCRAAAREQESALLGALR